MSQFICEIFEKRWKAAFNLLMKTNLGELCQVNQEEGKS